MTPHTQLQQMFRDNEPELRLTSYLPTGEARFQMLDCDSVRIGRMVCRGVRLLCIATEDQAYERLDLYASSDLPGEFAWLRGVGGGHDAQLVYAVMPSKLSGDLAHYSQLPRFGGHPYGFIVCASLDYEPEDNPGYGAGV